MTVTNVPLDAATRVRAAGEGRWHGDVAPGWDILGNTHGGYLAALATRAVLAETGRPDPVAVSVHFTAPGRPGAAELDVEVLKSGRTFATASASLQVGDRRLLSVLATVGDLAAVDATVHHVDGAPPELPAIDECVLLPEGDSFPPPFNGRVRMWLHPEDVAWADGEKSGTPRMRGWFALPDTDVVSTLALLVAVDAFPPTIFNLDLPLGWTPTVELTAHVRARPVPGPVRVVASTRFVVGGFLEEDVEVWDAADRLVAQGRQLALIPRA